jgi:hypothetical protein
MKKIKLILMLIMMSMLFTSCIGFRYGVIVSIPGYNVPTDEHWEAIEGQYVDNMGPIHELEPITGKTFIFGRDYIIKRRFVWKAEYGSFQGLTWSKNPVDGYYGWNRVPKPIETTWWIGSIVHSKKIYTKGILSASGSSDTNSASGSDTDGWDASNSASGDS